MKNSSRSCLAIFLAGLLFSNTSAAEPQVEAWIKQLDSDVFLEREEATEKLLAAGAPALPLLGKEFPTDSLEVATRAVYVLRELALSDDPANEEAAREVLTRIAGLQGKAGAIQASETLDQLDEIRQSKAIAELQSRGAIIHQQLMQIGPAIVETAYAVEIGEAWKGDEKSLRYLAWLRDIRAVTLEGKQVTDSWLQPVEGMENLTRLEVKRASLTDDGLASLAACPKLQSVSLMYTPVTDASLPHLEKLGAVSEVRLFGTKITKGAAERLDITLAGAKVDHRMGAFLGVGCSPHPEGCMISMVQPGSAAAKALLQVGDVIVKFNGKQVTDFENLTVLIGENKVGENASIEVLRNGDTVMKEIQLGEWE